MERGKAVRKFRKTRLIQIAFTFVSGVKFPFRMCVCVCVCVCVCAPAIIKTYRANCNQTLLIVIELALVVGRKNS